MSQLLKIHISILELGGFRLALFYASIVVRITPSYSKLYFLNELIFFILHGTMLYTNQELTRQIEMEFGWINLFGASIIVLIMIPNIIYAIKNKGQQADEQYNKVMLIIEQIGRYACIVFMWLPLLIWKFGFNSVAEMFVYLIGNAILLVAYYTFWILYFKKKKKVTALILAILPTCIFLISGILLRHWLLVISAILFGIGHIYITSEGEYVA